MCEPCHKLHNEEGEDKCEDINGNIHFDVRVKLVELTKTITIKSVKCFFDIIIPNYLFILF